MKKLFNFTSTETIETMQTHPLYNYKMLIDGVNYMQLKDSKTVSKNSPYSMILIDTHDGMVDVYSYDKEVVDYKSEKEKIIKDFDTYLMPLL